MNKSELVGAIAEKTGLSKKNSEQALKATLDVIIEALKDGDKVQLVGFGVFETRSRAARTARNPKTGETIQIPASKAAQFKPGKALKEAIDD